MDKKLQALFAARDEARSQYASLQEAGTQAEIRAASDAVKASAAAISQHITDDANECECGATPTGIVQEYTVRKQTRTGFEIGCLACAKPTEQRTAQGEDKPLSFRAFGATIAEATTAWNSGDWLP